MDIVYWFFSFIVSGAFMALGLFILFFPLIMLAHTLKLTIKGSKQSGEVTKEDIVNAQWEYDSKWRRRD